MKPLVLCSCECSVCLSVICVAGYDCICEFVCLLGILAQVDYWSVLGTRSCVSLASVGQLDLALL